MALSGCVGLALALAPQAQASISWPKSGGWDSDVLWADWTMSSGRDLTVEPHLAGPEARAVEARYVSGRIRYYYSDTWANNGVAHVRHPQTSHVHATDGTWVASYMQDRIDSTTYNMHLLYNGGATHQQCT